ncbi:MAG: DUF2807 domain-containing protein [Bacteroidales bacterium]|nr:DUF2807 domain-containing protein [Bacteroidales bacterium]
MKIKFLTIVAASIAMLGGVSLHAQTTTLEREFSEFAGIEAANNFDISVVKGPYGVQLTVDQLIADCVVSYVKGKVLFLDLDEKAIPKETKKLYKGKNVPPPVLRAVVYLPEGYIESIKLKDSATLSATSEMNSNKFDVDLAGTSSIKALTVATGTAEISLSKKSTAVLTVNAEKNLRVNAEGSSSIKLTQTSGELSVKSANSSVSIISGNTGDLDVTSAGSSQVQITSELKKADIDAANSSKVTLTGKVEKLQARGSNNSVIDASGMPAQKAIAQISNGEMTVNVSEEIKVELVSGASLYYSGDPDFKIVKIIKSTLAPVGTK